MKRTLQDKIFKELRCNDFKFRSAPNCFERGLKSTVSGSESATTKLLSVKVLLEEQS